MNKILYKLNNGKPSFWLIRDVPEFLEGSEIWHKYIQHLHESAIEIINYEVMKTFGAGGVAFLLDRCLWSQIENSLKDGDIFDLPEGLEFKEEEHYRNKAHDWWVCEPGKYGLVSSYEYRKIIRLIPKQKYETQDEFGVLFKNKWTGKEYIHPTIFNEQDADRFVCNQDTTNSIVSKFTISRKP